MAPRSTLAVRGWQANLATERKFFDLTGSLFADNNTPAVFPLFTPAMGSAVNQREGRKAVIASIQINIKCVPRSYRITGDPGVIDTFAVGDVLPHTGKWVLIWDKQHNQEPLSVSITNAMFFDVTQGSLALLNLNYRERFQVLKTKNFQFGPYLIDSTPGEQLSVSQVPAQYTYKYYKKCNLTTIFGNGDTPDVANITTGALFLVFLSDAPNDAGRNIKGYLAVITSRCRFLDP